MKKLIISIILSLQASIALASADPKQYLESVADQMIEQVESNQDKLKQDKALAQSLVKQILLPAIDTQVFAKKTLTSKVWKTLSSEQKKRFTEQFINLVVGNYATGLTLYDGQTFVFGDPRMSKSGKYAKVRSSMKQAQGTPITIDYVLSNKTGEWKIIDLTIEGVNMSKSYRSQFLPRIKADGMDVFLADLEKKSVQ